MLFLLLIILEIALPLSSVTKYLLSIPMPFVLLPESLVLVAQFVPLVLAPSVEHAQFVDALLNVTRIELIFSLVVSEPVAPVADVT